MIKTIKSNFKDLADNASECLSVMLPSLKYIQEGKLGIFYVVFCIASSLILIMCLLKNSISESMSKLLVLNLWYKSCISYNFRKAMCSRQHLVFDLFIYFLWLCLKWWRSK